MTLKMSLKKSPDYKQADPRFEHIATINNLKKNLEHHVIDNLIGKTLNINTQNAEKTARVYYIKNGKPSVADGLGDGQPIKIIGHKNINGETFLKVRYAQNNREDFRATGYVKPEIILGKANIRLIKESEKLRLAEEAKQKEEAEKLRLAEEAKQKEEAEKLRLAEEARQKEVNETNKWGPINFKFKDKYRTWNKEQEVYEVLPFEMNNDYQNALNRIEEQIKKKLKPTEVSQPLEVQMTHLSRAEVKDNKGNLWIFSTNDVFLLESSLVQNKSLYKLKQKEFNNLYKKYCDARDRVSSFTKQKKSLEIQNKNLLLIDPSADNENFWKEFNKAFKSTSMTFTDYDSYISEHNKENPNNVISNEEAYNTWKQEWSEYNLIHDQLNEQRSVLMTLYRQSNLNVLKDKDGRLWEEKFNSNKDNYSTITRDLRDREGSTIEQRGYARGRLRYRSDFQRDESVYKRAQNNYGFNSFTVKSKEQSIYEQGGWNLKTKEEVNLEGLLVSKKDFTINKYSFYAEGSDKPFIYRDLRSNKVYIPIQKEVKILVNMMLCWRQKGIPISLLTGFQSR